jgi:DNA-binding transcriptional regulator YiaG
MSNIASVLKDEIARIARKELRAETERLKKASSQYRSDIAALKRLATDLERQVAKLSKGVAKAMPAATPTNGDVKIRYSAKSLAAQRKRLGLSAEECGRLLNVSAQTIYNWEAEKARPRASQMPAIAALRKLGKRDATAVLAQAAP